MGNFDLAIAFVLPNEGGYSNNSNDAGGPTKYGITLNTLQIWRHNSQLSASDVEVLTLDEAKQIYRSLWWNALNLDSVNDNSVATAIFDQAINRGPGTVGKEIQFILNNKFGSAILVDGVIGPKTVSAINAVRADEFLFEFVSDAQDKYIAIVLKNDSNMGFLRGWIDRTQKLLKLLLKS